jgi:hypothetical protein
MACETVPAVDSVLILFTGEVIEAGGAGGETAEVYKGNDLKGVPPQAYGTRMIAMIRQMLIWVMIPQRPILTSLRLRRWTKTAMLWMALNSSSSMVQAQLPLIL